MKFQSFPLLLLPLLSSLPSAYSAPTPDPVFTVDYIILAPHSADFTYQIELEQFKDPKGKAFCHGIDLVDSSGEQRMICETRDPKTNSVNGNLEKELNVRIQQPGDRDPVKSGFNVLINWSGIKSRVDFPGGKYITNTFNENGGQYRTKEPWNMYEEA